jgi:hypothetical protein
VVVAPGRGRGHRDDAPGFAPHHGDQTQRWQGLRRALLAWIRGGQRGIRAGPGKSVGSPRQPGTATRPRRRVERDALKLDRQADESYRAGYYAGWEDATAAVEGYCGAPGRSIQTICAKFRAHMATALSLARVPAR